MGWIANTSWKNDKELLLDAIFNNLTNINKYVTGWGDTNQNTIDQIKTLVNKYGLTQSQVDTILNNYKYDSIFGVSNIPEQILADLQEMDSWNDYIGERPELPNPDDYYDEAYEAITKENEDIEKLYNQTFSDTKDLLSQNLNTSLDLYNQVLNRSEESLKNQLLENQLGFADYRNQLLTNEAMGQQAIAGSTRYELDRQQRNAISRGASAAQRLVANINTQLGLQAKSAQQSLDTSNALAQQLLMQRQAQAGLRQDYTNALNQYAGNTASAYDRYNTGLTSALNNYNTNIANLRGGQAERIRNYQDMRLGQDLNAYDIKNQRYKERSDSIVGTNPWASAYTAYRTKQNY